jgi:hypothetical protein
MSGISDLQGGHHVAKKLTMYALPLSDADENGFPSIVTPENEGACAGAPAAFPAAIRLVAKRMRARQQTASDDVIFFMIVPYGSVM